MSCFGQLKTCPLCTLLNCPYASFHEFVFAIFESSVHAKIFAIFMPPQIVLFCPLSKLILLPCVGFMIIHVQSFWPLCPLSFCPIFLLSLCPLFGIIACFMCCYHCPLTALYLPSLCPLIALSALPVPSFCPLCAPLLPSLCPLFAILACFMCCCHCPLYALIFSSFAFNTTLAREGKMRAERGQWQQHMKHSRMAKRGHKEGKKRAKPETVRMPVWKVLGGKFLRQMLSLENRK